jgi:hypothetical protein
MAHEYNQSPSSVDKPAEHPAKAIMAKRWEERRAEAHARRLTELNLGDSGLIAVKALASPECIAEDNAPVPTVGAAHDAAANSSTTANWLRDSRKVMLVVALVSHSLLLTLLYFGGFLS